MEDHGFLMDVLIGGVDLPLDGNARDEHAVDVVRVPEVGQISVLSPVGNQADRDARLCTTNHFVGYLPRRDAKHHRVDGLRFRAHRRQQSIFVVAIRRKVERRIHRIRRIVSDERADIRQDSRNRRVGPEIVVLRHERVHDVWVASEIDRFVHVAPCTA